MIESELSDQFNNNHSFINFVPNEEMSSDLQKKLKRINKLSDGLYETKFKIDRYKFDRAIKNELSGDDCLNNLFTDIMAETRTQIQLHLKSKSNSKLRNPLVNVIGSLDGIELAKERILSVFENIKMRVVLKMDVSYKDHSHIIGRGGFSIQRVMDDSGSHIHFPDSNRISDVKKSNVVLVCGSPAGVEEARCKIRSLLPLVVHFKIPLEYLKRVAIESYSKHLRSIQQHYNVHISLRYSHDIDESYAAIFDSSRTSKYIAVSVRGANNDIAKLKESLNILINRLTDFNANLSIAYALTIEITEFYHQLVMGQNYCNIKNIMQQTGCVITFPDVDANQRQLDFDNLNEIPVNKSTVIIKGPSFEAVHQAWNELIGYLPLVLTFDCVHDQIIDTALINQLKKQYKVAIFLKHKEKYNTVIIRGMEKNSRALFEVRKQLLKLDDAEIPICCEKHDPNGLLNNFKSIGQCDENGNITLTSTSDNTPATNLLNSLMNSRGQNASSSNLMNGNATSNILNTNLITSQNLDKNNNLTNLNEKYSNLNNFCNVNSSEHLQNVLNPMLFQAVFQEQYMLLQKQQQLSQRNKQQTTLNHTTGFTNNHPNAFNVLPNSNLNDEINKLLKHQQGLIESNLRNTHSVSDITSLQTHHSAYQNHNDNLNQSIKKDHLTTSCSSPSLHAMVVQNHNNSNSSLLNNASFSMNNSNLNSTGNNTSASSNATASTANNSFVSNGLTSSPSANNNSSFNSIIHSNQSPIIRTNNVNWLDQRRQIPYDECRYLALKNTYEKPVNEVRIPSNVWSGLGFSKSISQDTLRINNEWNPLFSSNKSNTCGLTLEDIQKHSINNKLNSANDFAWPEMINSNNTSVNKARSLIKQESEICSTTHPYSSSYLSNLINGNDIQQNQYSNSTNGLQSLNNSLHSPMTLNKNTRDHHLDMFIDINKIDLATVLLEYGLAKYIDTFKQFKIDFAQFLSLTEDDLFKLGINFVGRRKVYSAIIELRKLLQSNLIGNNYTKNSNEDLMKHQEDDLAVAIKKELKNFSSNYVNSPLDDQSQAKNVNGDLAKKLSLFDNSQNTNDNATPTKDKSFDTIYNAFGTIKSAEINKEFQDNYVKIMNSSNEIIAANYKFELDTNRFENDETSSKITNENNGQTKQLNNSKDGDTFLDETNEHSHRTSTNSDNLDQNLVNHCNGSSIQEIAQA